ncbi:hypothetical protein BGW36DRAFT_358835 [Talaromyces proteolyticus]|uniref:MICOS complex subunit MIC12 n=1 Tax=Talaromyces proteolyticus TaxID=1131652 RepID=A0AAD4PVQ8_9EURO|nr:uncharacterized protein BGW36DRAFT_358835 [Talaromyces proteolyticus]KAH8697020.1 hypothetical protein BGW36DRAFT_358835 [Talaromyces proteolyticus]
MGFMTGLFSGFTLTASVLYISVQVHRSTRIQQRDAIREQVEILNELAAPLGAYYRSFAPETPSKDSIAPKPKKPSAEELLKHQWNKEMETLATKALNLRWNDVSHSAAEGFKTITRLLKRE